MERIKKQKINDYTIVSLDEIDVKQFQLSPISLIILQKIQSILDDLYPIFGKTEFSDINYNLVFPTEFKSSRRKPVTQVFQEFGEHISELVLNFVFGKENQIEIKRFLFANKLNTLKFSENMYYYDKNIFHMHLDHKIGKPDPKDNMQVQTARIIFSTVPDSIQKNKNNQFEIKSGTEEKNQYYCSSIYLLDQPLEGIYSTKEFHQYMNQRYPECGISNGLPRPLYQIDEEKIYRAKPGEVMLHRSHPGTPIHSEANPCPNNRCLYVFDFENIRNIEKVGNKLKIEPRIDIPINKIIKYMKVLENSNTEEFKKRISDVIEIIQEKLFIFEKYPFDIQIINNLIIDLNQFIEKN
jgi:hypothetical protein